MYMVHIYLRVSTHVFHLKSKVNTCIAKSDNFTEEPEPVNRVIVYSGFTGFSCQCKCCCQDGRKHHVHQKQNPVELLKKLH